MLVYFIRMSIVLLILLLLHHELLGAQTKLWTNGLTEIENENKQKLQGLLDQASELFQKFKFSTGK